MALGSPVEEDTYYTYTHRTDDPFLLTQSTETKTSVANPSAEQGHNTYLRQLWKHHLPAGDRLCLGQRNPNPKTYTTNYQYNSLGQLTQINGPRTDVSQITTYSILSKHFRSREQPGPAYGHCQCPGPEHSVFKLRCEWKRRNHHRPQWR